MADAVPPAPGAAPPAQLPPVVPNSLGQQLDVLVDRVTRLAQLGGCYADIESQIAAARSLLTSGNLTDAQVIYDKAAAAVCRAETSAHAEPLAWNLLWLEAGYLALILGLGYVVKRYPDYSLWAGLVDFKAWAAWFGALGGVTIGIYGVYTHISAKDFDPSFRLWYICKPIMGAIFGWFVFLVYYVGVLSAQGGSGQKIDVTIQKPELAYLISFLAGFSERFTIKTIDRFMTVLTSGDDKNKDKSKDKPGSTQSSLLP
jgi:hypothetical protein